MNWGKGIIISFVLFAVFIGVLVSVCLQQDISLVSKNYYQEELDYQHQIDRMNNTNGLVDRPTITVEGGSLKIQFNQFSDLERGEVKLFRPSDVRYDKLYILRSSPELTQRFDVGALPRGMYRAKMLWTMQGKEYFVENTVTL